jgi:hypothetical protein
MQEVLDQDEGTVVLKLPDKSGQQVKGKMAKFQRQIGRKNLKYCTICTSTMRRES